ncbi:MAG TPA: RICIN domain-containing protein [Candidatus Limnocylindrales bacterium]
MAAIVAGAGLGTVGSAPAHASVTYHQIRSWHSGKCIDVDGASQRAGTVIQQYTCNGTVAQQWTRVWTSPIHFKLVVAASGMCMTVDNASQANAAGIHQQPCGTGFHQQFSTPASGVPDWPFLVARHSGKGVFMGSESLLDRAPLVQYELDADGPDTLHSGDWQFQ